MPRSSPTRAPGGLATFLAAASLLVGPTLAQAEGVLSLYANYYKERTTRVIAPTLSLTTDLDAETELNLVYLIDNITSASGTFDTDDDAEPFQEFRQELSLGFVRRVGEHLSVRVNGRYSFEPDYTSLGYGVGASLELFERNTTVSVGLQGQNDAIHARGNNVEDTLDSYQVALGVSQILSRSTIGGLDFEYHALKGYTENPYRNENHPPERHRHAFGLWLAQRFRPTATTLRASYRYYWDDWALHAHTFELHWYQRVLPDLELVPYFRVHTQDGIDFGDYNAKLGITYVTNDPKLEKLGTTALGLRAIWSLSFLEGTFLDALHRASLEPRYAFYAQRTSLELNPARWISPEGTQNAFGDAHIVQLGFVWPY